MSTIKMPHIFTAIIFYLYTLQFIQGLAVMTGDKVQSPETTTIITDEETPYMSPTSQTVPLILHNKEIFVHNSFTSEEPCEVTDLSSNKRAFNCSPSSSLAVSPKAKHCNANSRLVGESCLCNEGFRKFPFSEICVKKNGRHCVFQQNDCRTDLTNMVCINNVCSCEDSDIYDHVTSRCVGRVGGLCYPEIKDCIANAECVNVPSAEKRVERRDTSSGSSSPSYYYYETDQDHVPLPEYVISSGSDIELSGRCQCREGFLESQGGLCKKSYGQACASGDECDSLNLVCKEGFCACPDALHVYDLVSESCVALTGAKCSNEPGGTQCVELAFCQKSNLKMEGKCTCKEDALETNLRTCVQQRALTTTLSLSNPLNYRKNEQTTKRILFDV